MNLKKTFALWLTINLLLGTTQIIAQTANELYAKGINLEEVKGELEKAIVEYQKILDKFSTNRTVVAKSLINIGL